ncbi:ankyrin repeat domain-containing protein [Aspergillus lucknowensis]|uniref:Ankyrin repeat-containing domain protein n=1 Tax=Aspergillus lucknowensis TaxID=176173 RepID=A0ABR4L8X8_9EURO
MSPNSWIPLGSDYLCYRALAPDAGVYYPIRTVRDCTDWIVARLSAPGRRREICATLSRAAAEPPAGVIHAVLTENNYGYSDDQKRMGHGQRSDAPAHRLCSAICISDISLVRSLLDEGIDVNGKSDIFGSPLTCAARGGHLQAAQLLIEIGADVNLDVTLTTGRKEMSKLSAPGGFRAPWTALDAAAAGGHEEIVKLLLEPHLNLSRSSCSFFNAIIRAARKGNTRALQILMDHADFDAIPRGYVTRVLDVALKESASGGHVETMQFLLDAGAPVDLEPRDKEAREWTAVGRAAGNGHNSAIELLLDRGAEIDKWWLWQESPLLEAARGGFPRTVTLLIDRGAELGDGKYVRPLLHAEFFPWCVIKVLLEKGAHKRDPEATVDMLENAYRDKRQDVVDLLLEYGVTLGDKSD